MSRTFYVIIILFALQTLLGCTFTQKIKDGETAFKQKQYAKAVQLLGPEYEKTRDPEYRALRAWMLAESYNKMNDTKSAKAWYRTAFEDGYGEQALEKYAYMLKADQQYDNASLAFTKLIEEYGTLPEWETELKSCETVKGWIKEQSDATYQISRAPFNSESSDYAPIYVSESKVAFTSDRVPDEDQETYWWTGRSFSNLYYYDKISQSVQELEGRFNSEHNDGVVTYSKDLSEAFFTRCESNDAEDAFCKLYYTRKEGRMWTVPEPLPFQSDKLNYVQSTYWDKMQALIFSAQKEGDPENYDLYICYRRGSDWLDPIPLPPNINSGGKEAFPSMHEDTLYFSSDGLVGAGGLDIFKTHSIIGDSWAPPDNLRLPINSGADDFGFAVDPWFKRQGEIVQRGFFTSSRNSSGNGDNIYHFEKVYKEPVIEEPPPPRIAKIYIDGQVLQKVFNIEGEPNSGVKSTDPLPSARVVVSKADSVIKPRLDPKGRFTFELEKGTEYVFLATNKGFLNNSYELTTTSDDLTGKDDVIYVARIVLDPLIANKEIVLENIYYDFNKWDIRDDAKPTLDELVKVLKLNPTIQIEMGSHTDCRGTTIYNEDLSQKRAQSAVDYLISNGISADRLKAKGYGESSPVANCECEDCTEDEHQENRRTTFRIL